MVKVYAPASIGNIGVGFDVLGMAIFPINGDLLGDCVSVENSRVFNLQYAGNFSNQLLQEIEQDIVFQCWRKYCEILGETYPLAIRLEKNVPVSSGLGSSACSIVATLMAINHHCGRLLDNNQLLMLMGNIEGRISGSIHFDNVSPCFLGGMQLVLQEHGIISQKIPTFDHWLWIIAYPGIKISTEIARSILPQKYDRVDCINHSRHLSGFVHACYTQQEFLAIKCIKDIIAEPYRDQLLPVQLCNMRNFLIQKGAVSCGISGSGPTVFALCNTKDAVDNVSNWLSRYYLQNSTGFVQVCCLDNVGARIIAE